MPSATPVPAQVLPGVGPRQRERLARLGISTLEQLLFHLPLRYEDRTTARAAGSVRPGEQVLVRGEVELAEVVPGRRRRLVCRLADGTGALTLVFFNFYPGHRQKLRRGARVRCFGEVRAGLSGPEMVHPEWELDEPGAAPAGVALTPVYPSTEGLTQAALRRLVERALDACRQGQAGAELLPAPLLEALGMHPLPEALERIHAPPPGADTQALLDGRDPAVRRLAFEELLAHRLSLLRLRRRVRDQRRAPALDAPGALRERFLQSLEFRLTAAQSRVDAEIAADLGDSRPMLRLVQGDVGSGKTVVAALALLRAVECGWQGALMAPTELLAEQHRRNLSGWLEPLGVSVLWLAGRAGAAARRAARERLDAGEALVAVGTHALFQEGISFGRLALVVVDEQHRFGVHQRLALRDKGADPGLQPHQLTMTATPIPRTLAMTAYADLDCSSIDELPPGRTPVATVALPDSRRDEVMERVRRACAEGRQAYWVCTLVEESEALEAEAAEATAARLVEQLSELRVGLVHGRLGAADKDAAMGRFQRGELDLLVATTVIEVGVDVPNASLMIIENPERLGLAQLHQLRGRVGRGNRASACVLMYHAPLSATARQRLAVLRESNDGFRIAERDLALRGPGELLGTRQTGALEYRVADLVRDADLLPEVQRRASALLAGAPEPVDALIARWVGQGERYAEV